jgi:hypothetical protein
VKTIALVVLTAGAMLGFGGLANADTVTPGFGTYDLTLSDAFGTGLFGTVTVSDLGSGTAKFDLEVSPNFLLDTGAHYAFTFSLAGSGHVDTSTISSSHFTLASGTSFSNAPFGDFTSAIQGDCTDGNCGPTLGSSLIFNVLNFSGLLTATGLFDDLPVLFAADITRGGCTVDGCTGAVGATLNAVPLPGAFPLFATGLAGLGLLGWRRKKKLTA